MPLMRCQKDGKPGWKFGQSGFCYTYTPGNKQSEANAKAKAAKQGRAIQVNKASGIQSLRFAKKKFTRKQAVAWAKSHDFKYNDVEEMPNEYRLRQFPPGDCSGSGGMKDLDDGVRGYICPLKKSWDQALDILESIEKTIKSIM